MTGIIFDIKFCCPRRPRYPNNTIFEGVSTEMRLVSQSGRHFGQAAAVMAAAQMRRVP